jgi:hypothetical protein
LSSSLLANLASSDSESKISILSFSDTSAFTSISSKDLIGNVISIKI